MEVFLCPACGGRLFFDNLVCICGADVAFDPDARTFVRLSEAAACSNRDEISCNWRADNDGALCRSCATTRTHPDLAMEGHRTLWADAEAAKRRVMADLMHWGLFTAADQRPAPVFDMLAESTRMGEQEVIMGHEEGLITINVAEANPAEREERREEMEERYRTMTGHFRHEIGHFVHVRLADAPGFLDAFRALFGDERADYGAALDRYYANGAPPGWQDTHLTEYATAHPHEDWAETFAHFLHLVALTASAKAIDLSTPALSEAGPGFDAYAAREAEPFLTIAVELSVALNHTNRAMGLADLYPFVLTPATREKLGFVQSWLPLAGAADSRF